MNGIRIAESKLVCIIGIFWDQMGYQLHHSARPTRKHCYLEAPHRRPGIRPVKFSNANVAGIVSGDDGDGANRLWTDPLDMPRAERAATTAASSSYWIEASRIIAIQVIHRAGAFLRHQEVSSEKVPKLMFRRRGYCSRACKHQMTHSTFPGCGSSDARPCGAVVVWWTVPRAMPPVPS